MPDAPRHDRKRWTLRKGEWRIDGTVIVLPERTVMFLDPSVKVEPIKPDCQSAKATA